MRVNSSSQPTKKAVFKRPAASNLHWLPHPVVPPESNTNTSVKAPGPIWPPGTYIGQGVRALRKKSGIAPVDRLIVIFQHDVTPSTLPYRLRQRMFVCQYERA